MVLLTVIVVLLCVMNALLYWTVRQWGAMTEAQRQSIDAQQEMIASTNLVYASLIDAMAAIARIQKEGGNLPPRKENVS